MLENIVYDLIDLPYPKLDTEDLADKLFKLNSTDKLIYLGEFKPYIIDEVVEKINTKRKDILIEIRKNSYALGLESDERCELDSNIESIFTYEDFKKEFIERHYFKDIEELKSGVKAKFTVDDDIRKQALNYAKYHIELKEKKFEMTPKEYDRYEEKYIKEYISKEQSNFNEKESERLTRRKSNFDSFTKKYSCDIKGYVKYISDTDIYNILQDDFHFFIPTIETKRHTYISGMTGSGKSELIKLIIYSDILKRLKGQKVSTVLIEPHGDLSDEIVKFTEIYKNEDLIYLHPYLDNRYTITINPFELKEEDKTEQSIDILASELLNVFKMILGSSLTLPMESVLLPCITAVIYLNNPSQGNYSGFETLQRFMDDTNAKNQDLIEFAINNLSNINHQIFFKSAFRNKSLSVTKQALYTKIQTLLNSKIFSNLVQGKSTLSLEDELNKGKLIIMSLSKGMMGEIASKFYGGLILGMINHITLKRVYQDKENRIPINLIIDESQNYITPSIEVVLTELRKYGLHITLVSQIIGQNASTQLERIILSNTNIKIVGQNASTQLEKLSKEILVDVSDLQKLTVGEFYIKIGNKKAIKFKSSTMLLNNTNQITISQYNETKIEQLKKYYKKINKKPNISKTIPTDTFLDKKVITNHQQIVNTSNEKTMLKPMLKPMFPAPPK